MKEMAHAFNNLGLYEQYQGRYHKSLSLFQKSLDGYQQQRDNKGMAKVFNNMGTVHESLSAYPTALEYYQKALEMATGLRDSNIIVMSTSNIGNVYFYMGSLQEALKHYTWCYAYDLRHGNPTDIGTSLNNLALVHQEMGEFGQAGNYYAKALELAQQHQDVVNQIRAYTYLAGASLRQNDYEKVAGYLARAYPMAIAYGDDFLLFSVLLKKADLHEARGEYAQAIAVGDQMLANSQRIASRQQASNAAMRLARYHAGQGNHQQAYHFLSMGKAIEDSIFNERNERKILTLEQERLAVSEDLARKENELQKTQLKAQQRTMQLQWVAILTTGTILTMLFFVLLLRSRNYQLQKERHRELAESHLQIVSYMQELEVANRQLSDSQLELKQLYSHLEEKVAERTRNLEEANQKLVQFASLNSHELRRPIARIQGLVNLLNLHQPQDPQNQAYLHLIVQCANELEKVTWDINEFLQEKTANGHTGKVEKV
jgi:tetratricopeptide (TPR) repeat protein